MVQSCHDSQTFEKQKIKFCLIYTTLILGFSHMQVILKDTVTEAGNGASR